MEDPTTFDQMRDDSIGSILLQMYHVNRAKRKDYTGGRGIFANFIEASDQSHAPSPGHGIEYMIATKQSRLKGLLSPYADAPKNESIEDTLLDRAVYSVLALAAYREGLYYVRSHEPEIKENFARPISETTQYPR